MVWCQTPSRACAWHHTPRASAPHDPRLGAVEGWPKGIRADWAPRSSRPRTEAAQEREQCGHQDRAHDQRVDEDTQPHDECQRAEPPQQHQRQHREAGRRGEPGCGDGAGGVRDALRYGLAPRRVVGTGPDVADPVDVVVRAQPSSRSARPSDRRRVGRSACRRPAAVPEVLRCASHGGPPGVTNLGTASKGASASPNPPEPKRSEPAGAKRWADYLALVGEELIERRSRCPPRCRNGVTGRCSSRSDGVRRPPRWDLRSAPARRIHNRTEFGLGWNGAHR